MVQRQIKNRFLLLSLIILSIIFQGFNPVVHLWAEEPAMALYSSEEFGYSIEYPVDWVQMDQDGYLLIANVPDFEPSEVEGAGIAVFAEIAEDSAFENLDSVWENMKNSLGDMAGETQTINISQYKAYRCTVNDTENDIYGEIIAVFPNNRLISFVLTIHPKDAKDQFIDILYYMVDSITIE